MCLTTNKPYKIAKEDILCYKVLTKDVNNSLQSPFTLFKWNANEITSCKDRATITNFRHCKIITEGYFHTFKSIKGAHKEKTNCPWLGPSSYIYECTIPKGTKYWEGKYNGCIGFASKKLIVKSQLF